MGDSDDEVRQGGEGGGAQEAAVGGGAGRVRQGHGRARRQAGAAQGGTTWLYVPTA